MIEFTHVALENTRETEPLPSGGTAKYGVQMLPVHLAGHEVQQAGHAVVHEHEHLGDRFYLAELVEKGRLDVFGLDHDVQGEDAPDDEVGQIEDEPTHRDGHQHVCGDVARYSQARSHTAVDDVDDIVGVVVVALFVHMVSDQRNGASLLVGHVIAVVVI